MSITNEEVKAAQSAWGEALVALGSTFKESGNYEGLAKDAISKLYAYESDGVLFKPTKASANPFRASAGDALSYFVATNGKCSEDKGFALQPWYGVRFENHGVQIHGDIALAMGTYYFKSEDNSETRVEYSFGYKKIDGQLKIILHHSSLPYSE